MKRYFITGIDTACGKTLASAIVAEKLHADYWKPIQAGYPTDSETVRSLVSDEVYIHPERIILHAPMSPHAAAKLENQNLNTAQFEVPKTDNTLIIEGAGGLMVPINNQEFIIELAKKFDAKVVLISRNYLGSINHTLLAIAYLKRNDYDIAGIIFNDRPNQETEDYILQYSKLPLLGRIDSIEKVTPKAIKSQTKNILL